MLASAFARTRFRAQALALLGSLSLAGCDPPCPRESTPCPNGVELHVDIPAGNELDAYELEILRDDLPSARCLLLLPIPADWSSRWVATCDGAGAAYVIVAVSKTYDSGCSYGLSGSSCHVNEDGQQLTLSFGGQPSSIELRLEHDGQPFAPYQAALSYEEVRPDGPTCGNTCKQAALAPSWDELTAPPTEETGRN